MTVLFILYLVILGLDVTVGILKYRVLDTALKTWFWMLLFSLMSEIIASFIYHKTQTKAPVYHFYNIIELTLICYYFLNSIVIKFPKWVLFAIPIISTIVCIGNLILFQPILVYNTNVILIESVVVIGMALFALYKIMLRDDILDMKLYPHFHIWTAILVLWTGTFFFWAFLSYLKSHSPSYYRSVAMGQSILNICVYAFIGYAYYKYKKPLKLTAT